MSEIVVCDVGGTHVRFAVAKLDGYHVSVGVPVTFRAAQYENLECAWEEFSRRLEGPAPRRAALAVACPVDGPILQLTNNNWSIDPRALLTRAGLDQLVVINDLAAVGHAVLRMTPADFLHICGPDVELPDTGVISVVGLGTGLGVAHVVRRDGGAVVTATEGGHTAFAALDDFDDALLNRLRVHFGRVSIERLASGPGLAHFYDSVAAGRGDARSWPSDDALWKAAVGGEDESARLALGRICKTLSSGIGDIALSHGAGAVVISGTLARRLSTRLAGPCFSENFTAKGRFESRMKRIPVKIITHPEPGLLGAAAAFASSSAGVFEGHHLPAPSHLETS